MISNKLHTRTITPNKHNKRNIIVVRQQKEYSKVRVKACPDTTSVDPMFLQMYTQYICRPEETASCLMKMIVPVLEEQQMIVKQLISISTVTTIDGLEGTFMKFLLMHDDKSVDKLLNLVVNYNVLLAAIRDVVSQVNG